MSASASVNKTHWRKNIIQRASAPIIEFIEQDNSSVRRSAVFKRSEITKNFIIKHRLNGLRNLLQAEGEIDNFFKDFLDSSLSSASPNDIYSLYIDHQSLQKPIFIKPSRVSNKDYEAFLNAIFEVSQSNSSFILDGRLTLQLNIVKAVRGAGKHQSTKAPMTVDQIRKGQTKSFVEIESTTKCFLRALVVCLFFKESCNSNKRQKHLVKTSLAKQDELITALCLKYNIQAQDIYSIDDIKLIQQKLCEDYEIFIVDRFNWRNIIFKGDVEKPRLYIEFDNSQPTVGHFNSILSIKAYTKYNYFCEKCFIGFKNRLHHRCKDACVYCRSSTQCAPSVIKKHCSSCNITFPNLDCFTKHIEGKSCGVIKKCVHCAKEFIGSHECYSKRCEKCKRTVSDNHKCFIEPLKIDELQKEDSAPKIFVFFDIESYVNVNKSESDFVHRPMLLVSKTLCNCCACPKSGAKITDNCAVCGIGVREFFGDKCVKNFSEYLYQDIAKHAESLKAQVLVFAHNGKGYDFHFILNDIFKRGLKVNSIIMNGHKVMKIELGNIKFLDSLLFFGQSLSSLPKAFGIRNTLSKGYFPHLFNQPHNWSYCGEYPDADFYQPQYMKSDEALDFFSWYNEKKQLNETFNFRHEITKYCRNDVEILAAVCIIFRSLFLQLNGIDPFTRCFTIAQIGLELLRTLYLDRDVLGVTPINGYTNLRKCSKVALAWLDLKEKTLNKSITKEYRIGKYFADGFCPLTNTVFEFFGCLFHGCPKCFPDNRDVRHEIYGDSIEERYQKTMAKLNYYTTKGLTIDSIWECQFKALCRSSAEVKKFYKDRTLYWSKVGFYGHADVKESFFGGRTNCVKLFHISGDDEEIKYFDVNSLYPYVLKTKMFPVGHPIVINDNFDNTLESYFGFVKCSVIPPKDLYLPILPARINGKLIFPLCACCALNRTKDCNHSESERRMVGTWTTAELKQAIMYGYVISEIYEVLHYPRSSNDVFKDYINKFLKIKHEASGWPSGVSTDEEKEAYISELGYREEILLEKDKVEKNPALRFIAKIFLNSLWGKLAQNPNMVKTDLIYTYDDYWKKLTDKDIEITSEIMVTENVMLLKYKNVKDTVDYAPTTSVAVASFVTSYARLELYRKMAEVESIRPGSLLYFDTDSIIFYRKLSDRLIKSGTFLGQMKDEIKDEYGSEASIREFVSCGPKNYAYNVRLSDGSIKSIIKLKGITMNQGTANLIDFSSMLKTAKDFLNGEETVKRAPQFNICVDSHHLVKSRYFDKVYRVVSDKRYISDLCTFPYGYIGNKSLYKAINS